MSDHQPKNPAASIFTLELPEVSYRDDLEQPVLDMLFALLRVEVEDKPKRLHRRELERRAKKILKEDATDEDAQWDAMTAAIMKKYPKSGSTPDPVQNWIIPRLEVFWIWKTGMRPSLTWHGDSYVEVSGPGNDFFFWAAEMLVGKIPNRSSKHKHEPLRATANRLYDAYRTMRRKRGKSPLSD